MAFSGDNCCRIDDVDGDFMSDNEMMVLLLCCWLRGGENERQLYWSSENSSIIAVDVIEEVGKNMVSFFVARVFALRFEESTIDNE